MDRVKRKMRSDIDRGREGVNDRGRGEGGGEDERRTMLKRQKVKGVQ